MSNLIQWLAAPLGALLLMLGPQGPLDVSPQSISPGESVTVKFTDPAKANETVVVEVSNGDPFHPIVDYITLTLDENGHAEEEYTPNAGWEFAIFDVPEDPQLPIVVSIG